MFFGELFIMKSRIVLVVFLFLGTAVYLSLNRPTNNNDELKKGVVIILNGPATSGKTAIQKKLQEMMPYPYLALGMDTGFAGILPKQYVCGMPPKEGALPRKHVLDIEVKKDDKGSLFCIQFGSEGHRVMHGLHRAIAAYASQGNNVIVDYIMYEKDWYQDLKQVLQGYPVLMVKVDAPLEELEKREQRLRKTGLIGHVRSHYDTVHQGIDYDIVLDTSKQSVEECAQVIKDFIESKQPLKAFDNRNCNDSTK